MFVKIVNKKNEIFFLSSQVYFVNVPAMAVRLYIKMWPLTSLSVSMVFVKIGQWMALSVLLYSRGTMYYFCNEEIII